MVNFVEVGKDGKTPAMRLGLAKGVVSTDDILYCVFHGNWTPKPSQTGQAVQRKLDTHSTPTWTLRA